MLQFFNFFTEEYSVNKKELYILYNTLWTKL